MTISLIHPSRGRAEKATKTYKEWMDKAGCIVEHILSVDLSDDTLPYFDRHKPYPLNPEGSYSRLYAYDNKSVVEATNIGAKHATGDILLYLSDDFKCPDNWGQLILKEFEGATEPMLLKVDDCLQRFDAPVLTIPIMNRALYNKLGYFFHPDFRSMFCDEHLYQVAKKLNAIKFAPHLKFPHEHVSIGKAPNDETYRRSAANWEQGKAMMAKHRALGFPI